MGAFRTVLLCWISLLAPSSAMLAQDAPPLLPEGEATVRWDFALTRGTLSLTGICIVKRMGDGIVGSTVNEFGLHAFDFTARGRRVALKNVMPMMDKWYVRRLLAADLRVLVGEPPAPAGKHRRLKATGDSVELENLKRGLTYRFVRMPVPQGNGEAPAKGEK